MGIYKKEFIARNSFGWVESSSIFYFFICIALLTNLYYQVSCSLCSETMEREILAVHKGENCPQRIVTCEFCEFPLPAIDLSEHQVL